MATPNLSPVFLLTFDIPNGHLIFLDQSSGRNTSTKAIAKITNRTSGVTIYQSPYWGLAPGSWTTPDIIGSTSTWTFTKDLEEVYNGDYQIDMVYYDGSTSQAITRYFAIEYTAPKVEIELSVSCATSQLTSNDATDTEITMGLNSFAPTTTTREHTIVKPAGSGYTGTLGTTADKTRTVGGGPTSDLYLWSRVWQVNMKDILVWDVASWSTTEPNVKITDTIYGDDFIDVRCDATVCALLQCYSNLLARWRASLTGNFGYKEANRDTLIQANALFSQLIWQERCGVSTQQTILDLKEILAGEDCSCSGAGDDVSAPITPWAAVISGGGEPAPSTFTYFFSSSAPSPSDGNNGDVWERTTTGDIYQKGGGSWTLKGNNKGATGSTGAAGTDGTNGSQVQSNWGPTQTDAGTTPKVLDEQIPDFTLYSKSGDCLHYTANLTLGLNDHGKTIELYVSTTLVATYYTDKLIDAANKYVRADVWITWIDATTVLVETMFTTCNGVTTTSATYTIGYGDVEVRVIATNSTAAAGDIVYVNSRLEYLLQIILP